MYGMSAADLRALLRERIGYREFASTDEMIVAASDEIVLLIAENNERYDRVINNLVWQLNNSFGHLAQRVISLERHRLDTPDAAAK